MLITPLSNLFSFGKKRREKYRERVLSALTRVMFTASPVVTYNTTIENVVTEGKTTRRYFQNGGLAEETTTGSKPERTTATKRRREWRYSKNAVDEAHQVVMFYWDCIPYSLSTTMDEIVARLDMFLEGDVTNKEKEYFEELVTEFEVVSTPKRVKMEPIPGKRRRKK